MNQTHSRRRRLGLAFAALGALALTPLAPIATAAPTGPTPAPAPAVSTPAPADTHVSYYSFDADATTDSWGKRTGTLTTKSGGGLPLVEGKVGKAVHITPGNSVEFPQVDLLHNWSVGFWVKAPTATDRSSIIQSKDGVRAISQRISAERGNKAGMHVLPGKRGFLTYEYTLPNDTWTHITWTNSSTTGLALYANGKLIQNKDWGIKNPVAAPVEVLGGIGFTGLVDELKVYNRALTPAEVRGEIAGLTDPAPGGTLDSPAPRALKASFEVANPKPGDVAFHEGDVIRYKLVVTNDTGMTRSFKPVESNLDNWPGCKWSTFQAGATKPCDFPTHTVTADDVARGSFTPSITFQVYSTTGYTGATEALAPFVGAPTKVAAKLATIESFTFTGGTGKASYSAGDTLTATLKVRNVSSVPVSISVDVASACSTEIPAGEAHSCELTHALTSDDLERGEALLDVVVKVHHGDSSSTESATAATPTPATWPKATPFAAPNADPRLEARLTDLNVIEKNTSEYNIRIPAIAVASNGDLLASYDLRPINGRWKGGDSPNENSIVQRRSTDGGKTWGPMTYIAKGKIAGEGERFGWSDPSYVVDHETGEIFNFHVGSLDAGLPNGPSYAFKPDGKVDETHRRTMNFAVSSSTDNGHTWTSRLITNDVLGERAGDVVGCFATSGAGTQKMLAPHKGRLLQQAACKTKKGNFRALTIFSDDHGKTWQGGNFTSETEGAKGNTWNFDENKVVELSDGRLMLNSRIPGGSYEQGHRLVAISKDGGVNWGEYRADHALKDSQNNAQIIRAFPTAKKGTLRSKVVLFSNTKQWGNRVDGHVSMSYDDGATWPVSTQIRKGGTGYTTMAVQPDGSIGLLMEPDTWNKVGYVNFTLRQLAKDLPFELALAKVKDVKATDGAEIAPVALTSAGNDPALTDTYAAEGLPAGLSIDSATGEITGTPAVGNKVEQTFNVTVTLTEADDGTGIPRTASTSFAMTLAPNPVPETPEKPDTPEPGPGAPDKPETPETPDKPEPGPGTPDTPGAPDFPDKPEPGPKAPKAPDTSAPKSPDVPPATTAPTSPTTPAPKDVLASTGAQSAPLLALALALGGVGLAMLRVRRNR